jgi:hypothetical protein
MFLDPPPFGPSLSKPSISLEEGKPFDRLRANGGVELAAP